MIIIKAYQPGDFVTIKSNLRGSANKGDIYTILSVTLELTESDKPLGPTQISQILTIAAIDENGDDLGLEPYRINSDLYDIVELS